jgi:competence protein ComEC
MPNNVLRKLFIITVAAVMLGLSVWRYFAIPAPVKPYDGRTHHLTLQAAGFSSEAPHGKQVSVRLDGVMGVLYYSGEQDFSPGDRLTAPFRITLSQRSYSHFKASTYGDIYTVKTGVSLRDRPVIYSRAIKERLADLYEGDNAALLTGILTGDRSAFSEKLTDDLFNSGMTHVAAVSGLHVSILAGFITLLLRSRRRAVFISLPLVFLYVAVTGFTPSAMRAGIMIAIFSLAPLIGRDYNSLRALVAAFLILCVINPFAVFEPAMQLSFSASLGMIVFGRKWQNSMFSRLLSIRLPVRVLRFAASSLSATCAALVFSIPFAAYWFGGVSLLSPLSNLLLLWLVNVIFIGGVLSLFLPFLAPLAAAALALFRGTASLLAGVPYSVLYTAQPYLFAWLLYAYILFIIMLAAKRWKEPAALAISALILCLSMTVWRDGRFDLEITVIDVGQGQCVAVRSGGETLLFDCGGNVSAGRTAARYLQSRGVGGVDYIILSHYDSDHINGIPALAAVMDVGRIIGPVLEGVPDEYPVETVDEVFSFTLGKAEITVIPALWFGNSHARCVSVLVEHNGFSFLATGDMEHPGERWLLRGTGLSSADVLIAGHHGSAGSTGDELLDALAPQAVIISSGITNNYGHPSPETLGRLFERGIAVYRTDRRGNVTIRR